MPTVSSKAFQGLRNGGKGREERISKSQQQKQKTMAATKTNKIQNQDNQVRKWGRGEGDKRLKTKQNKQQMEKEEERKHSKKKRKEKEKCPRIKQGSTGPGVWGEQRNLGSAQISVEVWGSAKATELSTAGLWARDRVVTLKTTKSTMPPLFKNFQKKS